MTHLRYVKLLILLTIVMGAFLISLILGSVAIPFPEVIQILAGQEGSNPIWSDIIWKLRLPKALTATIAGAALAVSGLQMQTLFRNPLAEPSILGINAGASLGVALVVLSLNIPLANGLLINNIFDFQELQNTSIVVAASMGAGVTLSVMILFSQRVKNSITLLIFGLMFGYITNALVTILLQFSTLIETQTYLNWTFGSFGGVSWQQWKLLAIGIAIGLTIAQSLGKDLNLLALGEESAQSLGLRVSVIRFWIITSTALLSGTVTAFCGPISFLGIAVPHLCRQIFRSADHLFLIPATALLGSLLALVADCIAHLPGRNAILPLNSVTILIGAPVVIWIILKQQSFFRGL